MDQPLYNPPLLRQADINYARRRPEAWHAARQRFEAGEGAGAICRALGLGRSQLYQRARREGWARPDQLEPADLLAELTDADDGSGPPPDPARMIEAAWRQASRAVALGQIGDARAWTRLVRDLRALVPPATPPGADKPPNPDKPDGPDSIFSSPALEPEGFSDPASAPAGSGPPR